MSVCVPWYIELEHRSSILYHCVFATLHSTCWFFITRVLQSILFPLSNQSADVHYTPPLSYSVVRTRHSLPGQCSAAAQSRPVSMDPIYQHALNNLFGLGAVGGGAKVPLESVDFTLGRRPTNL